jgi:hypothetical protein
VAAAAMATCSKGTDRKRRQGEEERVDPSKEGGEGPTWATPVTDSASSGLAIADCGGFRQEHGRRPKP